MPNSLRAKISSLRYKGKITEEEYKDLISKLDGHDKALRTSWIPCSERLPEERDWYLAVFKESDTGFQLIPRVADYIGMGENKWQLMDEDSLSSEYLDLLECIAWQPLPEPYKGRKMHE